MSEGKKKGKWFKLEVPLDRPENLKLVSDIAALLLRKRNKTHKLKSARKRVKP